MTTNKWQNLSSTDRFFRRWPLWFGTVLGLSLFCNGIFTWNQAERDRELVVMLRQYLHLRLDYLDLEVEHRNLLFRLGLTTDHDHEAKLETLALERAKTEARIGEIEP